MKNVIVLIVIGSILFLSLLGIRGLCEPDEGRYAEIAREMINRRDWLTPRLNYIKHFHKPPLVYWFTTVSFLFFGINEFAARLPAALAGLSGSVITYFLAIKMGRRKTAGFLAGLALMSTLQYFVWTQVLSSDMVFSLFILLAFYGFWERSMIFYLGIALSFMVKGPVAVIIPLLVIGAYILITREYTIFKEMKFLKGILVFLVITCPWFIYVCVKNPGLLKYFILYQSLERLFTDVHGRSGNFFYFIPVFLIGGLPWSVFLPWALKGKYRENLFLILWIIMPILFFSFSKSKLPGYVLPVYPALAIITGGYFDSKGRRSFFFSIFLFLSIVYLFVIGILPRYEENLGDNLSIRRPAEIIKKYGSFEDKVVNFRCFLQGLPFYLEKRIILIGRRPDTRFEDGKDILKDCIFPDQNDFFSRINKGERIWFFTKLDDYPDLINNYPYKLYEIWKGSEYVLVSNQKLVTRNQK